MVATMITYKLFWRRGEYNKFIQLEYCQLNLIYFKNELPAKKYQLDLI